MMVPPKLSPGQLGYLKALRSREVDAALARLDYLEEHADDAVNLSIDVTEAVVEFWHPAVRIAIDDEARTVSDLRATLAAWKRSALQIDTKESE